jgi:hypothetical protein
MTRPTDYLAYIWQRIPGMVGLSLVDIYAARDMKTLTMMICQRGLGGAERVVYHRALED